MMPIITHAFVEPRLKKQTRNEIADCPFCGRRAEFDYAPISAKYEGIILYTKVKCRCCKAQTNIFRYAEDAIEAWNRRVGDGDA